MGTRCESIDPGVILYLLQVQGVDGSQLSDLLYERSGLFGVSALSADMRVLLQSHEALAREAIELFVFRVAREAAALAGTLGGLDALIFTAGVGENCPEVRAAICERLACNSTARPIGVETPRSTPWGAASPSGSFQRTRSR